jgi:transposase
MEPTDEQRRLVEHYCSIGYTQDQIAALMDISDVTLRKYYEKELKNGALKVNAQVGGKLFQKAMGGDTASLIFWAKTRMGWKETSGLEHSGPNGQAIPHVIEIVGVPPALESLTDGSGTP